MSQPDHIAPQMESGTGALLPTPQTLPWRTARNVPFRLAVTIPLAGMKLRDLCLLRPGTTLFTYISAAEDVPVRVGGALLGWAELDNVDGQMAIRLTRLT